MNLENPSGSRTRIVLTSLLVAFFLFLPISDWQIGHGKFIFYLPELVIYAGWLWLLLDAQRRKSVTGFWQELPVELRWALMLILVGGFIGALASPIFPKSFGAFKVWVLSPLLLFPLILAFQPRLNYQLVLYGLLAYGLLLSLVGLDRYELAHQVRLTSLFSSPNYFSETVAPIIMLVAVAIAQKKISRYFLLPLLLMVVALLLTRSLGGIFGLVVALAAYGLADQRFRKWLVTAIVLLGLIALPIAHARFTTPRNSLDARLEIWRTTVLMISAYPITGPGLRGYEADYDQFNRMVTDNPIETGVLHPHDLALAIWANIGVVGLIGFFLLILLLYRRYQFTPYTAALLVILGHGLIDTPYWKTDLVYLFWLYVALGYFELYLSANQSLSTQLNRTADEN